MPVGDRLILHWQEKDGPSVTPPTRKGFGTRVIERGLPHELITLVLALAGVRVGTMLIGLVGYEIWTRRGRH